MDATLTDFVRTKQIDSFQKLRFLLFLQENPETQGTCQEFAERLHLGDTLLLERIIADLFRVDLLVKVNQRWQLAAREISEDCLQELAKSFECPLTRQELLAQVIQTQYYQ